MEIRDLLQPESVVADLKAANKKQLLQELAKCAARVTDVNDRKIFETLLERERLGSTGVGSGIAIPHGKFADFKRLYGVFARLERPVEFDAATFGLSPGDAWPSGIEVSSTPEGDPAFAFYGRLYVLKENELLSAPVP